MRSRIYDTLSDFTDELIEIYNEEEDSFAVVCDFDTATALIKDILSWESDIKISSIEISDVTIDGYGGEYYITVFNKELWVEKARNDDYIILGGASDYTFIQSGLDNEFVSKTEGHKEFFSIGNIEE